VSRPGTVSGSSVQLSANLDEVLRQHVLNVVWGDWYLEFTWRDGFLFIEDSPPHPPGYIPRTAVFRCERGQVPVAFLAWRLRDEIPLEQIHQALRRLAAEDEIRFVKGYGELALVPVSVPQLLEILAKRRLYGERA